MLLRRADVAMYTAKTAGGGIEVYDPSGDRHSTRRLILANELRTAPRTDAIEVWYQPVADVATGTVIGCEALLRWNHSIHGAIPPEEFIPLAEQSGIISELTWWALDSALRQARIWHDQGWSLGVSVNIAARTLLEVDLLDRLTRMVAAAGVDAGVAHPGADRIVDHGRSGPVGKGAGRPRATSGCDWRSMTSGPGIPR